MNNFNYRKYAIDRLVAIVPEIQNLKDENLNELFREYLYDYDDEPLVTCIIEEVVVPFFISVMNQEDEISKDIARRIALVIEEFAKHDNFGVHCLVEVSFWESFIDKVQSNKDIDKYLLPETLKMMQGALTWISFKEPTEQNA